MSFRLFEKFTSSVDVTDQRYVHHQRMRLIPFSRTPFKQRSDAPSVSPTPGPATLQNSDSTSTIIWATNEWDDNPVGERPPAWLELSGDLAWTATFSSLTSNTETSSTLSAVSYGVFFAMSWQLWASQAAYDIKYYTNDWWHRIFFILQLLVYGGLASFTSDFDVFWGLTKEEPEFVYVLTMEDLDFDRAILSNRVQTKKVSFQGIALVLAISRLLLLIQYLRVAYYRYKNEDKDKEASLLYLLTPFSIAISSILFFASFAILKTVDTIQTSTALQLVLWGLAMVIEILGHAFTKADPKEKLRGYGSITERLRTLTVIVIGEGLNSLCSALRYSVNSLGFGFEAICQITSAAIILYFVWLLYFEGFQERLPLKKAAKEIWFILHLPFHLFLILLLKALKNLLAYNNLLLASNFFLGTLVNQYENIADGLRRSAEMEKALQKLGISWSQQITDSADYFAIDKETGMMQFWRWTLKVMYKLLSRQSNDLDTTAKLYYQHYMASDEYVKLDIANGSYNKYGFGEFWTIIVEWLKKPLQLSTAWCFPVAGGLLLCLGLLNYIQSRPQDRYAWGAFLNKLIAGIILICLVVLSNATIINPDRQTSLLWFMPGIAMIISTVAFVDLILLKLQIRAINARIGNLCTRPPSPSTTGPDEKEYRLVGTTESKSLLFSQAPMGYDSSMNLSTPGVNSHLPAYGSQSRPPSRVNSGGPTSFEASSRRSSLEKPAPGVDDLWDTRRVNTHD